MVELVRDAGPCLSPAPSSFVKGNQGSDFDGSGSEAASAAAGGVTGAGSGSPVVESETCVAAGIGVSDFLGSGVEVSSILISSSSVRCISLEARLNSRMLLPSDLPNSGNFRGPKIIRAMTKMMMS